MMERLFGSELRVGDTIETWFSGGRDMIVALAPYTGPLAYLWPSGARIAAFALSKTGMTIGNHDLFNVIARGAKEE